MPWKESSVMEERLRAGSLAGGRADVQTEWVLREPEWGSFSPSPSWPAMARTFRLDQ